MYCSKQNILYTFQKILRVFDIHTKHGKPEQNDGPHKLDDIIVSTYKVYNTILLCSLVKYYNIKLLVRLGKLLFF